jgi:LysM repeat protein
MFKRLCAVTAAALLTVASYAAAVEMREGHPTTYTVQRGDTLSQIAERFNVSVRQLMTWNQIRSSPSLRAGQQIFVFVDPHRVSGGLERGIPDR